MNCKFTIKNLSFFLDDEIPVWKKRLIKRHLLKCEECQRELAKLQKSNELLFSALKKKKQNLNENEIWRNINAEISETTFEVKELKWKPQKTFHYKKSFYYSFGVALILLVVFISFSRFWQKGKNQIYFQTEEKLIQDYPIVESINKENVTVMTYLTDDPTIKIVWFFED